MTYQKPSRIKGLKSYRNRNFHNVVILGTAQSTPNAFAGDAFAVAPSGNPFEAGQSGWFPRRPRLWPSRLPATATDQPLSIKRLSWTLVGSYQPKVDCQPQPPNNPTSPFQAEAQAKIKLKEMLNDFDYVSYKFFKNLQKSYQISWSESRGMKDKIMFAVTKNGFVTNETTH